MCSLAVQTTLQPWSASIYHSILQQGLQPSLTFTQVPGTLFLLSSSSPGSNPADSPGFNPRPSLLNPELGDRTVSFEDARVAVAGDMLTIGYVSRADGQLYLNPPETARVSPGDVLVALTTQDKVATSGVLGEGVTTYIRLGGTIEPWLPPHVMSCHAVHPLMPLPPALQTPLPQTVPPRTW